MDMLDQLNVVNNEELKQVIGGKSISGVVINYLNKTFSTIMDIGRNIGSSLRRFIKRKSCAL